jgi:hypothetical protein
MLQLCATCQCALLTGCQTHQLLTCVLLAPPPTEPESAVKAHPDTVNVKVENLEMLPPPTAPNVAGTVCTGRYWLIQAVFG